MIDILIPVLSRPQNAAPLVENIRAVTTAEHTITFICSPGDNDQIAACVDTGVSFHITRWDPGQGDFAKKINYGWRVTASDWVLMAADDLRFEPRWDTHAIRAAGANRHVVATNDLANSQVKRGEFGTHCLIRRRYVTEQGGTVDGGPGSVLHEGYDHNFVDRELCHTAQHRGVFAFARHSRVKHHHYLWKTAVEDDTYRKAMRHYRRDYDLFLKRAHLWAYQGLSAQERKLAA